MKKSIINKGVLLSLGSFVALNGFARQGQNCRCRISFLFLPMIWDMEMCLL